MSRQIVCLMGPTASGKTALAMKLVALGNFEIISVDSAMIYRGMDIGTAKPTASEQLAAPHHLIDILDPVDSFSVAQCCERIHRAVETITQSGKRPLLVGGTMMYFNALQNGLSSLPEASPQLRETLQKQAQKLGWPALHAQLIDIDPVSASKIHPHDAQRIGRALEVFTLTSRPLSSLLKKTATNQDFEYVNYLLCPENRSWLHARINLRFDVMLKQGFIEEVEDLLRTWPLTLSHPALRCVGYRQAYEYLQGAIHYTQFCDNTQAATRQLAKRQLTWLRHWKQGEIIACDDSVALDRLLERIIQP